MRLLTFFKLVLVLATSVSAATELNTYLPVTQFEISSVFDPDYQDHRCCVDVLKLHEIPKELRSAITVPPFYAPQIVPELYFLWLRYFAALKYDEPEENEKAKSNFRQALELLETNKQDGAIALWKNAWEEGNPEAYVKLQDVFNDYSHWCKVLSYFPTSETEMKKKIRGARAALDFFYGSADDSGKISLETPQVSIAFARFAEAKFINALENPDISFGVENAIRHMLQGVHVHYRKQWTQEKIGEMFDVSQSSVSNFLRGKPCPKLVQNVRKYYEENPDFYFFEPRKKSGWGISWRSFILWKSSDSQKKSPDEKHPLIEAQEEKKRN
jgi:hypothetical protein